MKKKWLSLTALASSAILLSNGCLGGLWDGLLNSGWPADNRWMNLGLDIANEVIFG